MSLHCEVVNEKYWGRTLNNAWKTNRNHTVVTTATDSTATFSALPFGQWAKSDPPEPRRNKRLPELAGQKVKPLSTSTVYIQQACLRGDMSQVNP